MKAVFFEQFGGPEVLKYGDLPDPVAGLGEVVVDVVAASVNAADWKFRAGEYTRHSQSKFPLIPGRDFSGVISAVGDGVEEGTDGGDLAPASSQVAIEQVGDAGGDEHTERRPAQPQPAVENAVRVHQRDHDRHRCDPAVGQEVGQRERPRWQAGAGNGVHRLCHHRPAAPALKDNHPD